MKDKIQTGRKYLQIIHLTEELYLQYIKSFHNSTTTTKIPKNMGKRFDRHFTKGDI